MPGLTTNDKNKAAQNAVLYAECARAAGIARKKDGSYHVYGLVRKANAAAFVSCVKSKGGQIEE